MAINDIRHGKYMDGITIQFESDKRWQYMIHGSVNMDEITVVTIRK